ncbi:F13 [Felid gammaherpesvirus 1]|uniref:F13 n=1 Tax=Felid gammaherpesvirus 1 TaxID=2560468 RepID=A0A0M4LR08_9GAMA|nr:F13 [Felis catus gammaherpesvirus 1]ALE14724.1 F13 [Felis catus gammaherpesvirus 1]
MYLEDLENPDRPNQCTGLVKIAFISMFGACINILIIGLIYFMKNTAIERKNQSPIQRPECEHALCFNFERQTINDALQFIQKNTTDRIIKEPYKNPDNSSQASTNSTNTSSQTHSSEDKVEIFFDPDKDPWPQFYVTQGGVKTPVYTLPFLDALGLLRTPCTLSCQDRNDLGTQWNDSVEKWEEKNNKNWTKGKILLQSCT